MAKKFQLRQRLSNMFNAYDIDGSGFIDVDEFALMAKELVQLLHGGCLFACSFVACLRWCGATGATALRGRKLRCVLGSTTETTEGTRRNDRRRAAVLVPLYVLAARC